MATTGRRADHGTSDDSGRPVARDGSDATADSLGRAALAERPPTCSVPDTPEARPGALWSQEERARSAQHQGANPGWRPGAKWAKAEVAAEVARLPLHQRPPMREMGRRSEAADHPFKAMPPDEAWSPVASRGGVTPVRRGGEDAHPPGTRRAGDGPYPGEGAFFLTGRMSDGAVGRACAGSGADVPSNPGRTPGRRPAGDHGRGHALPMVTAHRVDGRDIIHAACPRARALGLDPGTWLTQARATVPGLLILPADPEGDRAALHRLAVALARRWAPTVMMSDDAGLFIDLTGVAHLHGGEARFARRLRRLLARLGHAARIGIADTPGAAHAFARRRRDPIAICPPGRHREALAPLPADALRLEPRHLELLRRLGVDTVGELARLPRGPLARRFGGALVRRLDQALGHAPEPLDPVAVPERIMVEQRFAEPIATAEAIAHWLDVLVPRLCAALARAGRGARLVELVAVRVDGVPQIIRVGLARPARDPARLGRLLVRRIEEIAPGFGLDALALHVLRSDPLGPESLAPALAEDAAPDLAPLVDALANRLGGRLPWRARPVESDVPERSVAHRPPLDAPGRAPPVLRQGDVRLLDARAADHPWHPRWPRPALLLRHPERIEHVLAELPDQPPKRFTWRGTSHYVVRADGPERITGEWWRRVAEEGAVRDYFSVEDEAGHRFWLFRRGDGVRAETGDLSWHLHGFHG
ncbi:MAG TPA: DNA polymerase Y family protein [Sphingomonas sp.]|jgi:protein ImuB|uniref:Y-family DNA polymerase n=1 Tax=Sphingomonas sp. TaxID=28214 RepID=UPI002ED915E4